MENKYNFKIFSWRITAAHTIAYFIAGIFALIFMNYGELFGKGELSFMRSVDSPWVAAGPALQIIRGFGISLILFPFISIFLETSKGWLKFWLLNFGMSYIFTMSAAIGSFEGVIYTDFPFRYHLLGIPEIIIYTTLLSLFMWIWYKNPKKIFDILSVFFLILIVFMSFMGVISSLGMII